jgi:hypothetical protein
MQKPDQDTLASLYAGRTDSEVAALLGVHKSTIKRWRVEHGIKGVWPRRPKMEQRKFDRPSRDELIRLCSEFTDTELAARIGCSRAALRKWRAEYGIDRPPPPVRRDRRAYNVDEQFFAEINTEQKAYILGLLSTDGNIRRDSPRICLSLQARDEHILWDVKAAMKAEAPVLDRARGSFPGSGPMKYLTVNSQQLVRDLAALGVVPNKTFLLRYARLPGHLERHYLRGLLDGDGTLHSRIWGFLGTEALIDGVIDAVKRHTGATLKKRRQGKLWRADGYYSSRAVLSWLYEGASIFLARKHKIFEEHYS